ncbi:MULTISPECIES: DUF4190 domain-containing protein [Actinomadura]|uniref:DUF4190 domain-containing protein n=1 Tax=Actinomadura litoris TaxID=2678616 RepID=A0A7K1L8C2_9ACTN|nr:MULTISPECIES: DUF4190 domain-containing protein [Actinomadura]MBT2213080.1 hypothetical protein [Actinomadura sp. NEAU-AAG7]MUN40687.1 hypothetical protein [Actinomadura litoris]
MSGYGGNPPPGWEDPYGGTAGWDAGGYGASGNPYGQPPPGYGYGYGQPGYGPPGVPHAPSSSGSTIAALICNIIGVVTCCNVLAIPGVVLAAVAMGRVQTDPESARRLTMWSWILFAASIVLGIIGVILYILLIASAEPDYGSTTGV